MDKMRVPPPDLMLNLTSVLQFGKFKGETLKHVIKQDPDYILWALDEVSGFNIDEEATEFLNQELEDIDFEDEVWGRLA